MKNLLSIRYWKHHFVAESTKRYLVAVVAVACSLFSAVCCQMLVTEIYNKECVNDGLMLALLCAMSAMFVVIALARRKSADPSCKQRKWPYILFVLIWAGLIAYVIWQYSADRLHSSTSWGLFLSSLMAAALLPSLHTKDGDIILRDSLCFAGNLVLFVIWGIMMAIFACIGFMLLYIPLSLMTTLHFPLELFVFIVFTIPFMLTIFCYINYEPSEREPAALKQSPSPFTGVDKFLLGCFGYASLVMWLYMLIILFSMELPRGYISLICCSITALGLFTYLYVANTDRDNCGRWMIVHKLIPWLLLPIQVLMTIAIARRIYDYGVTIQRCYIVLLNVWAYAACLYIIICQGRNLRWIPLSLCLMFFIFTATPFSCSNYVRWQLLDDIRHQRGRCDDKATYLEQEFGHNVLSLIEKGDRDSCEDMEIHQ